jgi:DNA-directed RNA polymerase specialized sigma24 family protein
MPVYDQYSDEQLVAAAQGEDLGAWEAFLRRQGQRLLAFYTRMTGDEELSRELWVRSFNELWRQRATLARNGKAVTAVFTLATKLCAKASDQAPRRAHKGDPAGLESRSAGLRQALLGIPVRPRAALCLCYFDNVGFKEAERCLGAAPGEARQLCAEGYAALTRALGPGFLNDGLA